MAITMESPVSQQDRVIKNTLTGLLALACLPLAKAETANHAPHDPRIPALIPYPQQVELQVGLERNQSSALRLDQSTRLCFTIPPTPRLSAASARFRERLVRQQDIQLDAATDCSTLTDDSALTRLVLTVENTADDHDETTLAALDTKRESYHLRIKADGVQVSAKNEPGLLHGLQTLSQLIGISDSKPGYSELPALKILDYPRFRWRGLMLDSARHFFSVDTIKRQLDGMAASKLNVFHWHLTDDQGWRLESKAYPRLHETAPGGDYYSREQVREIVRYARDRGIVVVPEIDMPGHASAIAHAYPELISAPGPYPPEDRWGVHKPLLNPADPAVYEFAEKILAEVADLFPFEYVHIGGDEVDPAQWLNNPQIREYMNQHQLTDSRALHNDFNHRLAEILAPHGRKMIGWDEILHPGLAPSAAVQSWRGPDALGDIARAGHFGILSTGFYLDQPQYAGYHYRNNILPRPTDVTAPRAGAQWQTWAFSAPRKRGSAVSGHFTLIKPETGPARGVMVFAGKRPQPLNNVSQIGPYTTFSLDTWMGPLTARLQLQKNTLEGEFLVGNAPYHPSGHLLASSANEDTAPTFTDADTPLTSAQADRILGGEVALWSEMVTEQNIDVKLWPRAFAVAERLWSNGELRNEDFLYRRLHTISDWTQTATGLQHRQQQSAALEQLFPDPLLPQARELAAVLEPAHYYHRHHEKSANETYSRRDPLDRLADSLPAESVALGPLRLFAGQSKLPGNEITDETHPALESSLMQLWKSHRAASTILQSRNTVPAEVTSIAKLAQQQSELAFLVVERYLDTTPFSPTEEVALRNRLQPLKGIHHEMILPAVPALERLLDHLQHSSADRSNTGSGTGSKSAARAIPQGKEHEHD